MTTEMPLAAERDWPLFRVHSPIVACLDSGAMQSNESVEKQAGRRPLCSSAAAQGSWQGWRRGRRAPQINPISLVAAASFSTPSRMRFGPAHRILNAGRSRESAEANCSLVPPRPVTVVLIPGGLAPLYPGSPCDSVAPMTRTGTDPRTRRQRTVMNAYGHTSSRRFGAGVGGSAIRCPAGKRRNPYKRADPSA